MTLRTKTLLITSVALAAYVSVLFIAWRMLLLKRFERIERDETLASTLRAPGLIEEQLQQIDDATSDWSSWDDTYAFVSDRNERYREANLSTDSYANLRMDIRGIFDSDGNVVSAGSFDGTEVEQPFPVELADYLDRHSILRRSASGEAVRGIAVLPSGVVMLAARPILTSEHEGPPRGSFLYARRLNEARLKRIGELAQLEISVYPMSEAELPDDASAARSDLRKSRNGAVLTRAIDDTSIAGYTILTDAAGEPALLIRAVTTRLSHMQAAAGLRHSGVAVTLAGLVFGLAAAGMMRLVVLRRLDAIADDLSSVASGSAARVKVEGKDEIAWVARAVNTTLDALDRSMAQLAESEARFRALADATPVFIWATGTDGKCTYVNAGWMAFTGRTVEQEIGEGWLAGIHEDDRQRVFGGFIRSFEARRECELEFRVKDRHAEYRWVISRGVPRYAPDGSFQGFIGCCTDITDRKRMEEVTQAARLAAEAASRAKSEFLANMSHEIRTPMTAILGYADLLNDAGQTEESRRLCLQTIQRNGQHLLGIINDILDVSKIESGRIDVERIEYAPARIVSEVVSLLRVRSDEKSIELRTRYRTPVPASAVGDPTRIRQILVNLVGNAIKFTDRGHVAVEVSYCGDDRPMLRFDVIDTGVGMSPDHVERLFQPFTQADSSVTRRFGGTGLGLAISWRLASLMGGTIEVESREGVGSRFTLRLPALHPSGVRMTDGSTDVPHAERPEPVVSAQLSGRILLAEDGPDNQRLISFILRKAGAEVDIAENGLVALDMVERSLVEKRPYALILMDMQMPRMDGRTATRELRVRGVTIPIAALTAHAMDSERERCIECGCDDFAAKPIERAKLIEMCSRLMSRRAADTPCHGIGDHAPAAAA